MHAIIVECNQFMNRHNKGIHVLRHAQMQSCMHYACSWSQENNHKEKKAIKLVGWQILFILISPIGYCPSPCSARKYGGLNVPSVPDMSHSKPGWERSGVEERVDRENPWSGQGLLSQWSWVLAHISWLLPGSLLTAISRPYSFKALVGLLWTA